PRRTTASLYGSDRAPGAETVGPAPSARLRSLGWASTAPGSGGCIVPAGLAHFEPAGYSAGSATTLVPQHPTGVCRQGSRYRRHLLAPAGKCRGAGGRRETTHSSLGACARLSATAQRQSTAGLQSRLQAARHDDAVRRLPGADGPSPAPPSPAAPAK